MMRLITAFSTRTTSAASTFQVVVADGALGLTHTGFQFAKAIADAEREALLSKAGPTVLQETDILQGGLADSVFLQEVGSRQADVQPLVQPRLVETKRIAGIAAAASLP